MVGIAHSFIVEDRCRQDIAESFRVSVGLVSRINSQYRANENFVADLKAKELEAGEQVEAVGRAVVKVLREQGLILSVNQVLAALKDSDVDGITKKRVRHIMRYELGLKFKKTRTVNSRANLLTSRVQRQQFAMRLIGLMIEGKRIINIDESAVGQGVFIRRSWALKGRKNTHMVKPFLDCCHRHAWSSVLRSEPV